MCNTRGKLPILSFLMLEVGTFWCPKLQPFKSCIPQWKLSKSSSEGFGQQKCAILDENYRFRTFWHKKSQLFKFVIYRWKLSKFSSEGIGVLKRPILNGNCRFDLNRQFSSRIGHFRQFPSQNVSFNLNRQRSSESGWGDQPGRSKKCVRTHGAWA